MSKPCLETELKRGFTDCAKYSSLFFSRSLSLCLSLSCEFCHLKTITCFFSCEVKASGARDKEAAHGLEDWLLKGLNK